MSSSDELQKSMVIDKSNHLSFKMLAKKLYFGSAYLGVMDIQYCVYYQIRKRHFYSADLRGVFFPRCDWPYVPHCYCTCSGYIFLVDNSKGRRQKKRK